MRIDDPHGPCSEWSGWAYAYRTFWVDPGPEWDGEKVAEFVQMAKRQIK